MRNVYQQLLFVLCFLFAGQAKAQVPDYILLNGKVFTSDPKKPAAEAIAIRGDRILSVGTSVSIRKLAGSKTVVMDLQGKTVIPGINDAHDHIGFGVPFARFISFTAPMLPGPTLQQVLDSLSVVVGQVPKGTLIRGSLGMLLLEDTAARRDALDKVAPDHPVMLDAPWGHGTIVNTRAMQLLGLSETEPDPVGGYFERRPGSRQITGLLREYAEFSVLRKLYATLPDSTFVAGFRKYGEEAVRLGITSVQNMATALELQQMVNVLKAAQLPIRIRVIRFPGSSAAGRELSQWSRQYPVTPKLQVSGMKWVLDATPLERDAFMRTAYSDKKGWRGRLNFPLDTVRKMLAEGFASREQLLLHIVGDSTPNVVLNEMKKAAAEQAWKEKRVRFEHSDGLLADQWKSAKQMGIVVVVNPSHFTFAEVNHARIGEQRAAHYQPLRSLIEAGIPVAIGSDGPNNPYLNIMFAAIHPTNPREAITREQAVIAYTRGSAYAEFREKQKGMLKAGMLADLAVLSQDIFHVPLPDLPRTSSLLTIIGGQIVFDAGAIDRTSPKK
ncbi:MAG TPA: amidohydrolase [Flavisolibacter sp.]|nr:amidohydrolase [Flavisolibacter sp.]